MGTSGSSGTGLPRLLNENWTCTYGDLRILLKWEGRELCVVLVGGRYGNSVLRTHAQRELLAARRDAGDGLEARFKVRYAP